MKTYRVCATVAGVSKQYDMELMVKATDSIDARFAATVELINEGFEVVGIKYHVEAA